MPNKIDVQNLPNDERLNSNGGRISQPSKSEESPRSYKFNDAAIERGLDRLPRNSKR